MTAVRINFDAPKSEKEKLEALGHFDVQARKAARRLRTALAKIQLIEKSLASETKATIPSAKDLLSHYTQWISEAVKWATTDPLAEKDEPKTKVTKTTVESKGKKAAKKSGSTASKKSESKRADGQLKELRSKLKKEVKEDKAAKIRAALDAQKKSDAVAA